MIAGGVETILGVNRDPLFGPVVLFGLGPGYLFLLQNRLPLSLMASARYWVSAMCTNAAILLRETSLPFDEVARITGLDVYKVVGMKLKMRAA